MEERYVKTGEETFFAWHMHSDNAPSHFKSRQTMHYVTTLPERLKSWASAAGAALGTALSFRMFWEFGAPGHGKGVWDGIGAWMKRSVRQDGKLMGLGCAAADCMLICRLRLSSHFSD